VWFVLLIFKGGEQTSEDLSNFMVKSVMKGMIVSRLPKFMQPSGESSEDARKGGSRTLFNL